MSYKLYKIRCWNNDEEFYKIGITSTLISSRFKYNDMPYNYEIIDLVESKDGMYIWNLEKYLHKKHDNYKYIPKMKFGGWTECFSRLI